MRKRIDSNQNNLVRIFRGMGCSVLILSNLGECCDLLVAITPKRQILIEIKDGSKPKSQQKLTEAEEKFHRLWKGELYIITTEKEAIELVNKIRSGLC